MSYDLFTPFEPAPAEAAATILDTPDRHPEAGLNDEERLAERLKDKKYQLRFRRQAEVRFDDWHPEDLADLDYEIDHAPQPLVADPTYRLPTSPFLPAPAQRLPDIFRVRDTVSRPKRSLRTTTGLSAADCKKAYEIVLRANAQGLTMSTHVVITWKLLGVMTDVAVHKAQAALLASLRDSAKRRRPQHGCFGDDRKLAWIWVLERSGRRGLHSHILFTCPPAGRTRLLRSIVTALGRITGTPRNKINAAHLPGQQSSLSAIEPRDVRPVVMTAPNPLMKGGTTEQREIRVQWSMWRYIFKGVGDPSFTIPSCSPRDQGMIIGKRWGHSTAYVGDKAWAGVASSYFRDRFWFTRYVKTYGFSYPLDVLGAGSPAWLC